jgi:hypothetical protein
MNVIHEVVFSDAAPVTHTAIFGGLSTINAVLRVLVVEKGVQLKHNLLATGGQLKNRPMASNSNFGLNGFSIKKEPFSGSSLFTGAGSPETKIIGMAGQSALRQIARSFPVIRGIRMSVITRSILLRQYLKDLQRFQSVAGLKYVNVGALQNGFDVPANSEVIVHDQYQASTYVAPYRVDHSHILQLEISQ